MLVKWYVMSDNNALYNYSMGSLTTYFYIVSDPATIDSFKYWIVLISKHILPIPSTKSMLEGYQTSVKNLDYG